MNNVEVYCELRSRRILVGRLTKTKEAYVFEYADNWLSFEGAFDIGPDLPLSRQKYESKKLPESFKSRIPPRSSANYERYCEERGIPPDEKDELTLLTTIGHKGPSSFVFEEAFEPDDNLISKKRLDSLKQEFSLRTIADLFGISLGSLQKILSEENSGPSLQLLQICLLDRNAFQFKLRRAHSLSDKTRMEIGQWAEKSLVPLASGKYSSFKLRQS